MPRAQGLIQPKGKNIRPTSWLLTIVVEKTVAQELLINSSQSCPLIQEDLLALLVEFA
jgi:hypothetical protein